MKINKNIILITLIAISAGIGIGYLLFNTRGVQDDHQQQESQLDPEKVNVGKEEIWTCSMHPQIRQAEPGKCPICEMDLIPLETSGSNDPKVLEMTEAAVKLANIQTTIVGETGKAQKVITLSGKIQVDERLAASQVAHVPGRIEQLFVTFKGEQVQIGDRLATIYAPELITAQQELLQALKFSDVSPGLIEAARNKLRFWKIPARTIEQIENSGKIQETFTVYADASGIVTNRKVAVGDYVNRGQNLFDLISLDRIWVLFDAYEEDLGSIRKGNYVKFTTPALPGKTFSTQITYIDPVINPQTRTASLRAELSNINGVLKPEMFIKGTIDARTSGGEKLMVPKTAVLWTGPRSVVYVKVPDIQIPSFEFREIGLGETVGENYLVLNGLESGEEVVTYGNFTIDAAAQLNNQFSMMNRNVKVKNVSLPTGPDYQDAAPAEFKKQMESLVKKYLDLKDAFVATNMQSAGTGAKVFAEELDKVDMTLVKGDAHNYWMGQLKGLRTHSQNIFEAKDVETQRKQFQFLSDLMIETVQAYGIQSMQLFVIHCPMAFDNEGADWISDEEEVRNPYFGDKMLKCGIVKGTLPSLSTKAIENAEPVQKPQHQH